MSNAASDAPALKTHIDVSTGRGAGRGQVVAARKIIIDTDPGQDDAVAILLALASPELDVLGITAVAGTKTTSCFLGSTTRISANMPGTSRRS